MKNFTLLILTSSVLIAACSYPDKVTQVISPDGNINIQSIDLQSDKK